MARTRVSSRKRKSAVEHDRYTAEMSTGQLVIGVCILLMFGLGCFLLGVLIGRIDPSLRTLDRQSDRVATAEPAARPDPTPAPQEESEPELRPPMQFPDRNGASASDGQNTDGSPEETASAKPSRTEPGPDTTSADAASEEPPDAAENGAEAESASETSPTPPTPQVVAASPPTTRSDSPTVASSGDASGAEARTRYGVQIAAFQTRARAEISMRELEAKSPYRGQIVVASNGRLYKVIAGSYADNATAAQARQDLRTRYNYSDCFVTSL